MMERHLVTEALWTRWTALLERHPGYERDLDARASLLVERFKTDQPADVAVSLAMDRAEFVHEALAWQEKAPAVHPTRRPWAAGVAAVLALAAGLVITAVPRREPDPDVTWRGDEATAPVVAWGTIEVEQSRRSLGRLAIGRGVHPPIHATGPIVVRWRVATPPVGVAAWTYLTDASGDVIEGPTALSGSATLTRAAEAARVVTIVAPKDADLTDLVTVVGAGDRDVEPLGAVHVVVFRLR